MNKNIKEYVIQSRAEGKCKLVLKYLFNMSDAVR